jgi:hypothetical protein
VGICEARQQVGMGGQKLSSFAGTRNPPVPSSGPSDALRSASILYIYMYIYMEACIHILYKCLVWVFVYRAARVASSIMASHSPCSDMDSNDRLGVLLGCTRSLCTHEE